jgi:hypothetical protein
MTATMRDRVLRATAGDPAAAGRSDVNNIMVNALNEAGATPAGARWRPVWPMWTKYLRHRGEIHLAGYW